jgi:hypothetical protein
MLREKIGMIHGKRFMREGSMRKCVLFAFLLCSVIAQGSRWSRTGDMIVAKSGFPTVGFTNSEIMIFGGLGDFQGYEIFDPTAGTWARYTLPSSMDHSMAMLIPDGRALTFDFNDVWLYNPDSAVWVESPGLLPDTWVWKHCATLLKNGDVLCIDYSSDEKCALWDWATNTARAVGSTSTDHQNAVEVMLPSGEVMIMGGRLSAGQIVEIYDPVAETWRTAPQMSVSRKQFVGTLLRPPYQQVLVAGPDKDCELYDPLSNSWSSTGDMNIHDRDTPAMALLPSGKALMIGGNSERTCELYDPASRTWSMTDTMKVGRDHLSAAILPTGKVLAIGRFSGPNPDTCEIYDPSDGVWTGKPSLNVARSVHTVTPLPIVHTSNCSTTVLVVGGGDGSGNALKSCELYNYTEEDVQLTGELNIGRCSHATVLLTSGLILTTGGGTSLGLGELSSCELFTPISGSWASTGDLATARFDHTATLLPDGTVLVTGGDCATGSMTSCEVYSGGSWSGTGNMATDRARHSAVLLPDGRIMVIGGFTSGGTTNSCEIWNGSTWSGAASMSTPRFFHTTTVLQSGKVLVTGGRGDTPTALASCELYDPAANTWSSEADLNEARYFHNSTILYSGLVLVTGGWNGSDYTASCEMWDPAAEWDEGTDTHGWKVTASLGAARGYHSSALIPDEKPYVLVIGGTNSSAPLNSIEEYDVGLGYLRSWQSTITNQKPVTEVSSSMHIEGTLFRGLSEADGGNHCHIANNDHPIISLVRIGGGNWQGNGGGELLYMPFSHSWDQSHTDVYLPTDAPSGYYRLWSIVNGIPCKWYEECLDVEDSPQSTVHSPQFSVFPNPATHNTVVKFVVRSSQFVEGKSLTLKIHDLSGRVVRTLPFNYSTIQPFNQITVSGLNPGIYFCSVKSGDTELRSKFTIVK